MGVIVHTFVTTALYWGKWTVSCFGCIVPWERGPEFNIHTIYIIHTVHVLIIMYYPTNALRDTTHKAYMNFYMLRYLGAIPQGITSKTNVYKPTCRYMCIYILPVYVYILPFYKGPYVSATKAFSHLPRHIKILVNDMKCFKLSLKRFLCHHSFYSVEEYYEHLMTKTCRLTVILTL